MTAGGRRDADVVSSPWVSTNVEPFVSETGTGPSEPGEQLGRYRLLRKIARGGMAEVYVARSFGAWGFEKTVAIKRILDKYGNDPAFIRMMVDEAKITVLLNHPNVAQVLELAEQDGDYFIVMEFVPGVSLSTVSKRLRERAERLGLLETCFIVTETLQGLHAAHEQRDGSGNPAHIIHRDVSPQNVLLSFDGHVKVIDFGIARARHRLEMTEVGTIKGKLRYLAPEMIDPLRFMRSGDFDHRVDVFAAGIVLWELIANRTLYEGDDEMAVYDAITDQDAPRLAASNLCDRALSDIVARALARAPDERYPSAEAFADDLRAYLYRSDPAFTHRRVAAVLGKHFPTEKEELLAIERGAGSVQNTAAPRAAGASGPNAAAPRPAAAASAPAAPPKTPPAPALERSSSKAERAKGAAAMADSTSRIRRERGRKAVVDVGDARAPNNAPTAVADLAQLGAFDDAEVSGSVLTVNTLVSRSDRKPAVERAASFAAGDETLTRNAEPRPARAARVDSGKNGRAPGAGASVDDPTLAPPPLEPAAQLPAVTAPIEGTSSAAMATSSSSLDTASNPDDPLLTRTGGPGPAGRRSKVAPWLLAAATGVGVALLAIVVKETSRPQLPPLLPKTAVHVIVSTNAKNAVVLRAGVELPAPARLDALPGDSFEILVKAPGYGEEARRVVVPREAKTDLAVEVPLQAPPRPLELKVTPAGAEVLVNDQPWAAAVTFPVGSILMVQVSAPGFVAVRKELQVTAEEPLRVEVELRPEAEAVKSAVTEPPRAERTGDKRPKVEKPAPARKGTLKVKTKPFITEVTIDGARQADTTPLTVELAAGKHTVVVRHAGTGQSKSATLTVKPGATTEHTFVFDGK